MNFGIFGEIGARGRTKGHVPEESVPKLQLLWPQRYIFLLPGARNQEKS